MRTRRFLPRAEAEFLKASKWYALKRPGLGDEYIEAVEEVVDRAMRDPETGSPHLYDTRRMLVDRFPYEVIYVPRGEQMLIVAVAHQRRKPGYWHKRLEEIS